MRLSFPFLVAGLLFGPAAGAQTNIAPTLAGPAEHKLRQLIAVVDSGGTERIRAFIREVYEPDVLHRNTEDRVVQYYAAMHDRSGGLVIDSLRSTYDEAAALLRSRRTGLWEQMSLRVEAEAPHRLLDFASFSIAPPRHALASLQVADADRVLEIGRLAATLARAGAFSGVVLVAKGDSLLFQRAFGSADRARGEPLTTDSRMQLASLTKMFVTVAVARLVEKGSVSWDDTVGHYFPELPAAARAVRVKHLVTHTSGLWELSCDGVPCPARAVSTVDHLHGALLSQKDSLRFPSGSRAVYTNTNYALLGRIVELASGCALDEFVRENVFSRAGMTDTDFFQPGQVPRNLAVAYHRRFEPAGIEYYGELLSPESTGFGSPWAGTYSTALDVFRFARALIDGNILDPPTVRTLMSPKPEAGAWSYGFDILDEARALVGHGGSWNGISNSLDMFTSAGYTVVILSNVTNGRSPLREAIRAILP